MVSIVLSRVLRSLGLEFGSCGDFERQLARDLWSVGVGGVGWEGNWAVTGRLKIGCGDLLVGR